MDRGHEALFDAHEVVEHIGHRRQAVGGAGRVRHDQVVLGQRAMVHAVDDGLVGAARGGRNQHALGPVLQVQRRLFLAGEEAGAFHRHVDVAPGQVLGVADRGDADRAAAHVDRVAVDLHLAREAAVHAVEADEMGVGLDRAEIVDGDHLDVGAARLDDGAQDVAPDAPETVDRDLDRHVALLA